MPINNLLLPHRLLIFSIIFSLVVIGTVVGLIIFQSQGPTPSITPQTNALFDDELNEPNFATPKNLADQYIEPAAGVSITGPVDFNPALASMIIPVSAPIFKVISRSFTDEQATRIADHLGFDGPVQLRENPNGLSFVWNAENPKRQLEVFPGNGQWVYQDLDHLLPADFSDEQKLFTTEDEVKAIAETFLRAHRFNYSLSNRSPVDCFKGELHRFETNNLVEATGCELTLFRLIDGYGLYKQLGQRSGAEVVVSQYQKVQLLSVDYPLLSKSNQPVSLLNPTEIEQLLADGQAVIVRVDGRDGVEPVQLGFVRYNQAELGYFDDGESEYLLPLLVLTGSAVATSDNRQVNITAYLQILSR